MPWARWKEVGIPEIIYSPKSFKDSMGITHPKEVFTLWTDIELATIDWYTFIPFVLPSGERVLTYSYSQVDLQIIESAITEVIPPPTQEEIDLRNELEANSHLDEIINKTMRDIFWDIELRLRNLGSTSSNTQIVSSNIKSEYTTALKDRIKTYL